MPPSLILHIGSHKTGTTSIQHELARRRSSLARRGIHYCTAFPGHPENHSVPVYSMFCAEPAAYRGNLEAGRTPATAQAFNRQNIEALRAEIASIDEGLYVVSGEDIAQLRDDELDGLRAFTDGLVDGVRVVYCVREPLELIGSLYQQLLRSGRASSFEPRNVSARYHAVPRRFADAFGVDSTIVYRFEDAVEVGVVSHFASRILGIDAGHVRDVHLNRGLSAPGAALLRLWGDRAPRDGSRFMPAQVGRTARRLLARLPGPRFEGLPAIDAAACKRINTAVRRMSEDFGVEPYDELSPVP